MTSLSTMLHDEAVTVGQVRVSDGTNEITQAEAVLEAVEIPERTSALFTMDAAHARKEQPGSLPGNRDGRGDTAPATARDQPLLVTSSSDRDPASVRLLALTWWPTGIAALTEAAWLPPAGPWPEMGQTLPGGRRSSGRTGIALRQWAITTLGQYFVGHVLVQPSQTVVSSVLTAGCATFPRPASGWK